MFRRAAAIGSPPSKTAVSRAVAFGFAANILRAAPATYTFAYMNRVIAPALRHKQIKFYFDTGGNEVGYVVWAMLAPGVEAQFLSDLEWNLHPSEWNEGENLWILDLVAPHGNFKDIMQDLANNVFAGANMLRYYRIRRGKVVERTILREPSGKITAARM